MRMVKAELPHSWDHKDAEEEAEGRADPRPGKEHTRAFFRPRAAARPPADIMTALAWMQSWAGGASHALAEQTEPGKS